VQLDFQVTQDGDKARDTSLDRLALVRRQAAYRPLAEAMNVIVGCRSG